MCEFRAAPVVTSTMELGDDLITIGLGNQTRRHANCCMLREGRKTRLLLALRGTHLRTAPTLFAATPPQIPRLTAESVVVPPLAGP
jgi:hypothetical protein